MKRNLAFVVLLFAAAFASAQTADCAALTHQALELSGFNQRIEYLTTSLVSDAFLQQMQAKNNSDEFTAVMKPVLEKEFSGSLLRKELQDRMAAHCDPEQMTQTVQRLQTPLVSRMLALEAATDTAEGQEKLRKYINIARTVPPTDDRMDAIDALDTSAGTSEFVTDFEIAMLRGMMTGAGAPPEVLAQIQARRKDIKSQRQTYVQLGMNVTYHGVTRPELAQYTRELSAQPLKGFYTQMRKTFVEIVEERAQAMGRDLKKTMVPPKS
jgi:hypothetical protein